MLRDRFRRRRDKVRRGPTSGKRDRAQLGVESLERRDLLSLTLPVAPSTVGWDADVPPPPPPWTFGVHASAYEIVVDGWPNEAGLAAPPYADTLSMVETTGSNDTFVLPSVDFLAVRDTLNGPNDRRRFRIDLSEATSRIDLDLWVPVGAAPPNFAMNVAVVDRLGETLFKMPMGPGHGARIAINASRPPRERCLFLEVSTASTTPIEYAGSYAMTLGVTERPTSRPTSPIDGGTSSGSFDGDDSTGSALGTSAFPWPSSPSNSVAAAAAFEPTGRFAPSRQDPTVGRDVPLQASSSVAGVLDFGFPPTVDARPWSTGAEGEPIIARLLGQSSDDRSAGPAPPNPPLDPLLAAIDAPPTTDEAAAPAEWDEAIATMKDAAGATLLSATLWMDAVILTADGPSSLILADHPDLTAKLQLPPPPPPPAPDAKDHDAIRPPAVRAALLATAALVVGLWFPDLRNDATSLHLRRRGLLTRLLGALRGNRGA